MAQGGPEFEGAFPAIGFEPMHFSEAVRNKVLRIYDSYRGADISAERNTAIDNVARNMSLRVNNDGTPDKRKTATANYQNAGHINQQTSPLQAQIAAQNLPEEEQYTNRTAAAYHEDQEELFQKIGIEQNDPATDICRKIDLKTLNILQNMATIEQARSITTVPEDSKWIKETAELCKSIVMGRVANYWAIKTDLLMRQEYETLRSHMLEIISFLALLVIYEMQHLMMCGSSLWPS